MTPLRKAARALVLKESGTDSFDALSEELQEQVIESVKAVLEALREPSERQCVAAVDRIDSIHYAYWDAKTSWETMIDAAIADG